MLLGLLFLGMVLGGVAAAGWVIAGGSVLAALAIYAGIGTVSILVAAAAAFLLSELRLAGAAAPAEAVHPAE
jgi:hypothetical protein